MSVAISATVVNSERLTSAEKLQYDGYPRREEANGAIVKLVAEDISIKEIVRRTGHSWKPLRQAIRGKRIDAFRAGKSSLESYLPFLDLLRVVHRRTEQPRDKFAIIGVDDFASRRGQRYGTIVCDLERRRPVTLLPDREQDTSRVWLAGHPSISIVARDRGGGYGEAIAKALPHADQVADRWHLMENASRAFLDAVGKSMRHIRKAVGNSVIDPRLLTHAERLA